MLSQAAGVSSAALLFTVKLVFTEEYKYDLALKYGYDTPEAFTRAFVRFHGFPPASSGGHIRIPECSTR